MPVARTLTTSRPLKFFLLVFGLSTPLWLLQIIIGKSGLPLDIPITDIVAAFVPLGVAYWLTHREQGSAAARALLKRIFDFRRISQRRWYLAICLLPAIIFIGIYLALMAFGSPLPEGWNIAYSAIPILFLFFFFGALGEEVGYMGYAFEPLERKWGALSAALIIGLPWAIWHFPSMLAQGRGWYWILWGTIGTVAIRVIIVWIYKNTNASLFACILFHALYNLGRALFPHNSTLNPLVDVPAVHYGVTALIAVVIALWTGSMLTRHKIAIGAVRL